jgi:hypothetical protein
MLSWRSGLVGIDVEVWENDDQAGGRGKEEGKEEK